MGFESHMFAPDSSYVKLTEYYISTSGNVKPLTETIDDKSGAEEYIDEYEVTDGAQNLVSRIIVEDERDITYQENIDGSLQTIWNIRTVYNEDGEAIAAEVFSHNTTTGETKLEYTYDYTTSEPSSAENKYYSEYTDEATNTIHALFNDLDNTTGEVISRLHFIINADDQMLKQIMTEVMIDGEPYLTDGMYFVYDEEGALVQGVAYGPKDKNRPGENLHPYLCFDFLGLWEPTP